MLKNVSARANGSLLAAIAAFAAVVSASAAGPKFYPDDPIASEPESQDASGAQPTERGLMYELATDLFVTANYKPSGTRARNINTIDEVPDSSWFTNRIGSRPMTGDEIARGPNIGRPPAPERWVLTREKSGGANPGFTAKDANGETWFLGFDRRDNPEGPSAAVVIASKLFWSLGYNQVELFLTTFDRAKAVIDPAATMRRPSGARTPFTSDDVDEVLQNIARNSDGSYRVVAGRLLPGKVLGPFRYEGTRPDDPNDIVPHEHRRELRALRVFGAWTNLTDLKAGNTLDTLITENGRAVIKHVLQDVGSTFGMANRRDEWDLGWEYFFQADASKRRFYTFGFGLSPWQTVPYKEYPSVGRIEGKQFDPRTWAAQTPTTAYLELRADDAFWAARRVMAFSDEMIRAVVHTGEFSDPVAERHLGDVIIQRRDVIGRTYLPAINPIVNPRLDASNVLSFDNAAVSFGFADAPAAYRARWSRFDNATGATESVGETRGQDARLSAPAGLPTAPDTYLEVDIAAESSQHPSWAEPIRTFFRRTSQGWTLVGLERLPEKISPDSPR